MGTAQRIMGIDPGQDVGVCLVEPGRRVVLLLRGVAKGKKTLLDEAGLAALIAEWRPDHAVVERVGPRPGQGGVSGFGFGCSWGLIRGVLRGRDVPYSLVTPQSWKKAVLGDYDAGPVVPKPPAGMKGAALKAFKREADKVARARKEAQKDAAVAFVGRTYPDLSLLPPRARVPNHNMAEAVCLAHWGLLTLGAADV